MKYIFILHSLFSVYEKTVLLARNLLLYEIYIKYIYLVKRSSLIENKGKMNKFTPKSQLFKIRVTYVRYFIQ